MNHTSIKFFGKTVLGALLLAFAVTVPLYAQQNQAYDSSLQSNQAANSVLADGSKTFKASDYAAKEKAAPAPAPAGDYDWNGGYIGGHFGYGWGKGDTQFDPLPSAAAFVNMQPRTIQLRPRGATGGVQGGYNWQNGHLVIGSEADFSWTNIKRTTTVSPIVQNNGTPFPGAGFQTTTQKMSWFGTLRPRAGVAFDRVFIYGTAGLAFGRVNYSANTDFRPTGSTQYPATLSKTKAGWTAGGGAEIGINKHFSVKAEYLYYDLGNVSTTVSATPALPPFQVRYTWETKGSIFNTGVNFRF